MPRMTGLELLKAARGLRPDAVGIIVTAFTDVDVLIEAINLGRIYRYVTKPWDAKELRGVLIQAVERFALVRENRRLEEQLGEYAGMLSNEAHGAFNFGAIVGDSPALREVLARVEQVAQTSSTVLLRGETGTGKEMVARAIHINSARESKPFVRVNCAALAQGVLESELFGHEKGAFTGAMARRLGRFELADGGTLFLDEVGDLPLDVQVKLLRVLQEREFERVGGSETVKVDVRVVSATHRDLERQIGDGSFREDLYYRLNVFPILLPPLRERPSDIAALAEHFAQKFAHQLGAAGRARGFDAGGDRRPHQLQLARQRPRAGERHRAGPDPGPRPRRHRRRSGVHPPRPGPGHRRHHRRAQRRCRPPAVRTAARAGAGRDRRRDRLGAGEHRSRRPGPGDQPLDPLLPDAQARPRTPATDEGPTRMKFLFVMDPLARLQIAGDTTFAIMLAAQARGHEIWFCEPRHLSLEHADAVARAWPVTVRRVTNDHYLLGPQATVALKSCDAVFMRKDPPFDLDYYFATLLLERARGATLLINDPRGLREQNEKLAVLEHPELCPPTIVTRETARLRSFMAEQGGEMVVKPLDASGGFGVFHVRQGDPNTGAILEQATNLGRRWTMAQKYLPEVRRGDKRILLVDGEPLCAVLRVPAPDEARGNLHVGARPMATKLDERDEIIVRRWGRGCANRAISSSAWT